MDKREIRLSATKKFMDNFDQQFSHSLVETESEKSSSESPNIHKKQEEFADDEDLNLSDLEEAIADIEKYMEETHQKQPPLSTQD
jgi:hypothetical protein